MLHHSDSIEIRFFLEEKETLEEDRAEPRGVNATTRRRSWQQIDVFLTLALLQPEVELLNILISHWRDSTQQLAAAEYTIPESSFVTLGRS